jgi:hypothetical protein
MLQAGVGDVLNFLLNPPGCQVRRTTAQSIPNNTVTAISFDTEDFDSDTMHDPASNPTRLTCQTPGRYLAVGSIPYDTGTTGNREARLAKNGSDISGGRALIAAPGGAALLIVTPVIEVSLVAGDFLELRALQTNGGALTTTAVNSVFPMFRARWVGP